MLGNWEHLTRDDPILEPIRFNDLSPFASQSATPNLTIPATAGLTLTPRGLGSFPNDNSLRPGSVHKSAAVFAHFRGNFWFG